MKRDPKKPRLHSSVWLICGGFVAFIIAAVLMPLGFIWPAWGLVILATILFVVGFRSLPPIPY